MNNETPQELTVKELHKDCKGFECPRLLDLSKTGEGGRRYFTEGDMAYRAMALCNNWTSGLSNGDCPIQPIDAND